MEKNSMHKDPTNYPLITYAWVIALSVWGGTAHTIRKVRDGTISRFSISEWIGDIVISGFLGLITFYLCEAAAIGQPMTAVLVGITSHQGTKGIMLIEKLITKKITKDLS